LVVVVVMVMVMIIIITIIIITIITTTTIIIMTTVHNTLPHLSLSSPVFKLFTCAYLHARKSLGV